MYLINSLVAGVSPINIELEYTNNGPEDARGLVLVINGLSNDFFTGFTLTYNVSNLYCVILQYVLHTYMCGILEYESRRRTI